MFKMAEAESQITSLKDVNVSYLEEYRRHLESISKCEGLNVGFWMTKNLPEIRPKIENLRRLNIEDCDLDQYGQVISEVSTLKELTISGDNDLPKSFAALTNLRKLNASGCKLKGFPDLVTELKLLESLTLSGHRSIKSLPDTLGQLQQLQTLDLSWCG